MAFSVRGARRLCASGGGLGRPATAAAARRGYFSDTLSLAPLNRVEATVATTPRVLMDARGRAVSPWHDVPLRVSAGGAGADGACYFVCEVPRGATARLHVSVATAGNPLVQGLGGDGKPRHLPFATLANHGVLPQTYTGPGAAGAAGAPLAVCEVGSQRAEVRRATRVGCSWHPLDLRCGGDDGAPGSFREPLVCSLPTLRSPAPCTPCASSARCR